MISLLASALRVMTFNVNYAAESDPAPSLAAIADADPDIVLLQEVTGEWQRAIEDTLGDRYPHRMFHLHYRLSGGLAVLSKYPIVEAQLLPAPSWFPAERIVTAGIQLLNVHLRPAIDGGSWFKGFVTTPPIRLREIETFWPKLDRRLPTVIAGDFNEDPHGAVVAFLTARGLARVPTDGPTTWRYVDEGHELLKMDIDHVVICDRLTAKNARVIDAGNSDHRPVVVTLARRQ